MQVLMHMVRRSNTHPTYITCPISNPVMHFDNILVLLLQVVISIGAAVAAYGEMQFILFGVLLQLFSVATESICLTLVQTLLQVVLQPFTSDMPEKVASWILVSFNHVCMVDAHTILYHSLVCAGGV